MREKLFEILSAVLEIPQDDISSDLTAENVESWDSLKHLNIVLTVEQEFGVAFTDEDILNMLSVQGIMDQIEFRLQG